MCKYYGDILITSNVIISRLRSVFYSPELTVYLFSLRNVTDAGMKVTFIKNHAEFVDSSSAKTIKTAEFRNSYLWVEFDLFFFV